MQQRQTQTKAYSASQHRIRSLRPKPASPPASAPTLRRTMQPLHRQRRQRLQSGSAMNIFDAHGQIVDDYADYIRSFINISDPEIARTVEDSLAEGRLWPQPLLQFNPAYEKVGTVKKVVESGCSTMTSSTSSTGTPCIGIKRTRLSWALPEPTSSSRLGPDQASR